MRSLPLCVCWTLTCWRDNPTLECACGAFIVTVLANVSADIRVNVWKECSDAFTVTAFVCCHVGEITLHFNVHVVRLMSWFWLISRTVEVEKQSTVSWWLIWLLVASTGLTWCRAAFRCVCDVVYFEHMPQQNNMCCCHQTLLLCVNRGKVRALLSLLSGSLETGELRCGCMRVIIINCRKYHD